MNQLFQNTANALRKVRVSKEFVSIQLNHNITDRAFDLTQEDYWVKAVERFKEHLNDNEPKTRLIP